MDMKRTLSASLASIFLLTSLTGCGTQPADRAISGALIGAAAGGAVFALFPSTPITLGLATGGALGAIGGGLSLPDYMYLGEPAWTTHEFNAQEFRFQRRQAILQNPQPGMLPPQSQQQMMQRQQQPAPQPQMQQPQYQQQAPQPQYQQQQRR